MNELILDVRLDGFNDPVGTLTRSENAALNFQYRSDFLLSTNAMPISLSLPLGDESIAETLTRSFFNNLLQERDAPLQDIMERENITRDDLAGLLFHLGKDCAGAISVLPAGAPATKVPGRFETDYEPISDQRLIEIVEALQSRGRPPDGLQDPSPLAGVQSKISLTILPNGQAALPKVGTGAPTTHIIKVPSRQNTSDAKQEAAALNLSQICGLETAKASVEKIGEIDVLMASRFDRTLNEQGQIIRLHQEDFAQALGLPPSLKYERNGNVGRRFDVPAIKTVLDQTIDPAISRLEFIKLTVFDLLIGNSDGHAKNHALLYRTRNRPELSPRYDLLPTRMDPNLTDELPYSIGAATKIDEITKAEFSKFLRNLGVTSRGAQARITSEIATPMARTLSQLLTVIQRDGLKGLADQIASNMRQFLPALEIPVPEEARNRDAFVRQGGGWLTS